MNKRQTAPKMKDRRVGNLEIYVLRPPSRRWRGLWWIYAPLAKVSTMANDWELERLEAAVHGGGTMEIQQRLAALSEDLRPVKRSEGILQRLMLVPTAACNFHCRYCFAAAGHSRAVLSENAGRAAIDHYLACSTPDHPLDICFLGGGEPTLELQLANRLLDYAERRNDGKRPCNFSIVTNGGGDVAELVGFALRHKVSVGFSFDILKEVQERNRGHYSLVEANLRALLAADVDVTLKATITPDTVALMEKMVLETIARWPNVSSLQMEPVLAPEMYPNREVLRSFYNGFTTGWFRARRTAKRFGARLGNSLATHVRLLLDRYCDGTFLVGPNGIVSACEFVSTPRDPGFTGVLLGHMDVDGRISLDGTGSVASKGRRSACEGCFAKWHCAGGCGHRRLVLGEVLDAETCRFTRRFMARVIFGRFEELCLGVTRGRKADGGEGEADEAVG